jgi:Flp pilus assembly protein CpaB
MIEVMGSRRTIVAALALTVAAFLAVFLVFVNHHRRPVHDTGGGIPLVVLVAKVPIQKGTAGDVVASVPMYRVEAVRASQIRPGALAEPSSLRGKVALTDIVSGEQLTATEFGGSSQP